MVIGLTGSNASGKGEVASYLRTKGYVYHSLSDILRGEAKKLGIEPLRENLIELGNDLRQRNGPAFLALCLIEDLSQGHSHVIDSIRNPAEIEALRKIRGFMLIGIDAPVELRFERSLKRKRPGDAETLQGFMEKEERENRPGSENQQLKMCLQMAEITIVNDSTIDSLHKKIDAAIKKNKAT